MVSYPAFFDELVKIAEATNPPAPSKPEEDKKTVTKRKLLRLAKVVGAAGAGAAVGGAAGAAARRWMTSPAMKARLKASPWYKKYAPIYGPAVAGGLAGGGLMALHTKDKKVKEYLEKEDEGKRPK